MAKMHLFPSPCSLLRPTWLDAVNAQLSLPLEVSTGAHEVAFDAVLERASTSKDDLHSVPRHFSRKTLN